jgi:hypothetical protein
LTRTRKLIATLALTAAVTAALAAPAAAHHPLTKREAAREFRQDALENYDVDYFEDGPACFRMSRYVFRCVAVVVYFDGDSDCVKGPVRATGPAHHRIQVNGYLC